MVDRQEPKLEAPFHIYLGEGYVREYPHKKMGPDISTGNLEPWS